MAISLQLSVYTPNFNDPRIRKRAEKVLVWCDQVRLINKGKQIHHEKLLKIFGNYRQPGLAQWLFSNLLSQSGKYQSGVSSFTYKIKESGYRKVHEKLGTEPPTEIEVIQSAFCQILQGGASPEYNDKGDRRYHPIQNIKRDIRKQVFAGWWDYDIEACAPTLIYQFACRRHEVIFGAGVDPFPAVSRLIHDKVAVRSYLVKLLGIDMQQAKEILAALFFRATQAPSSKARLFSSLGNDEFRFYKLVNDQFIVSLTADVKLMWSFAFLQKIKERELIGASQPMSLKKAAQVRMKLYLSLERRVIDAIEAEFPVGLPVVLIHDGFMCKQRLDIGSLEKAVLEKTGFVINLSETQLCQNAFFGDKLDVENVLKNDPGEMEEKLRELNEDAVYGVHK